MRISAVPVDRCNGAFTAFDSTIENVSLISGVVSPLTSTLIVFAVSPGANVSDPLVAT